MITDQQLQQTLEKLFEDIAVESCDVVMIPTERGFQVFGQYEIVDHSSHASVYQSADHRGDFTSARIALGWCIAKKYNQLAVAQDIQRIDQRRAMLREDISVSQSLLNRYSDPIQKETVLTKLTNKKHLLSQLDNRLDKCINLAKYWQTRGFIHEIERTGRVTPHRTSNQSPRKSNRTKA
jgi:hypothetical protein